MHFDDAFLVVMAGRNGSGFWPKSTSRCPKQLLSFGASRRTLLAATLARFGDIIPPDRTIVLTNQSLAERLTVEVPGATVLAEPRGRNTAPALYWAARVVAERDPEGLMIVTPSDHYVARPEEFRSTVVLACARAREHRELVVLGVVPTRPETRHGYLRVGVLLAGGPGRRVEAFVENPPLARAREFVKSGRYWWNAGMFVWRGGVVLEAFDSLMPEFSDAWRAAAGRPEIAYPGMTATSLDYGIMEHAANVVAFPLDCGWHDISDWADADAFGVRTESGVVTAGQLVTVDARDAIVDAPGKLVAILGLDDLIVVEHGAAILIADKARAHDVKLVVDKVRQHRPDLL